VKPFKLGFMTHVHGASPAEAYRQLTELFVAADELGIDGGFVAQHNLAGPTGGQLSSPLVGLAAIAGKTRTIELGTAAVILPLEDPVRLAEDAAVLDTLSGGRLQLGLGTGGANLARYPAYGKDAAVSRDAYFANLEILVHTLAGDAVRGTDARLTPPAAGVLDRIWGAHGSPGSARLAARYGTGLMYGTSTLDAQTVQKPIIDAYLDEWSQRGPYLASATVRDNLRPRLGAIRMVYPSSDRRTALDELSDLLASQAVRVAEAVGRPADQLSPDEVAAGLTMHLGHPDEVARSLREDPALLSYVEYFVPVLNSLAVGRGAGSALEKTIRGLEVIATEIAPQLGWRRSPDPVEPKWDGIVLGRPLVVQAANNRHVVAAEWLADHLDDPGVVVLDATTVFAQDDGGGFRNDGRAAYEGAHIPGAVHVDLHEEVNDRTDVFFSVSSQEKFSAAIGAVGVGPGVRVVIYDQGADASGAPATSAWAARLWWQLRFEGFDAASVLLGGLRAWQSEGRPVRSGSETNPPRNFRFDRRPALLASADDVLRAIGDPAVLLVDSRAPDAYAGLAGRPYRAGHIPSAVNLPSDGHLDRETGELLPRDEIRRRFVDAGVLEQQKKTVFYCGGGVSAAWNAWALVVAGGEDAAVYDGSILEWSNDPARPLVVGN
jgi:3-mercaptopyruvate sulfurtransferase SseA/alkanesulfonate monooxygenase SsuD/methylene tetrahydromethanopterin reductase-like flavin-dependent oxidoreductase (luciferase family)